MGTAPKVFPFLTARRGSRCGASRCDRCILRRGWERKAAAHTRALQCSRSRRQDTLPPARRSKAGAPSSRQCGFPALRTRKSYFRDTIACGTQPGKRPDEKESPESSPRQAAAAPHGPPSDKHNTATSPALPSAPEPSKAAPATRTHTQTAGSRQSTAGAPLLRDTPR